MAVFTAKGFLDIMRRHARLPAIIITNNGSVFVFEVMPELAEKLDINLKRSITKHAKTIAVLERAHTTIKASLKWHQVNTGNNGGKFSTIAHLNYNTIFRSSIHSEPSRVFHDKTPHIILEHKLGLKISPQNAPTTDCRYLLRKNKNLYDKTRRNVMQFYINYKSTTIENQSNSLN